MNKISIKAALFLFIFIQFYNSSHGQNYLADLENKASQKTESYSILLEDFSFIGLSEKEKKPKKRQLRKQYGNIFFLKKLKDKYVIQDYLGRENPISITAKDYIEDVVDLEIVKELVVDFDLGAAEVSKSWFLDPSNELNPFNPIVNDHIPERINSVFFKPNGKPKTTGTKYFIIASKVRKSISGELKNNNSRPIEMPFTDFLVWWGATAEYDNNRIVGVDKIGIIGVTPFDEELFQKLKRQEELPTNGPEDIIADGGESDGGESDGGESGSGESGSGTPDGGESGSGTPDGGESGSGTPDGGESGSGTPDGGESGSGTPDGGESGSGTPDGGESGSGTPDGGESGSGTPDEPPITLTTIQAEQSEKKLKEFLAAIIFDDVPTYSSVPEGILELFAENEGKTIEVSRWWKREKDTYNIPSYFHHINTYTYPVIELKAEFVKVEGSELYYKQTFKGLDLDGNCIYCDSTIKVVDVVLKNEGGVEVAYLGDIKVNHTYQLNESGDAISAIDYTKNPVEEQEFIKEEEEIVAKSEEVKSGGIAENKQPEAIFVNEAPAKAADKIKSIRVRDEKSGEMKTIEYTGYAVKYKVQLATVKEYKPYHWKYDAVRAHLRDGKKIEKEVIWESKSSRVLVSDYLTRSRADYILKQARKEFPDALLAVYMDDIRIGTIE